MDRRHESSTLLLVLGFVFIAALVAFGVAVHHHYKADKRRLQSEVQLELHAIADMKVDRIDAWRKERKGDAENMLVVARVAPVLRGVLERSATAADSDAVLAWMKSLRAAYGYANVILLDRQGTVRLSLSPVRQISRHSTEAANEAIRSGKVVVEDLHRNEDYKAVQMAIAVPVLLPANARVCVGAVLLWIDAGRSLYPQLRYWPTSSRTAETILARREGDEVLILSELRYGRTTALNLRFPIGRTNLLVAMAARGQEGLVEGVDYRGRAVLAALRRIPESPWFLITKVDTEEIYAELAYRLRVEGVIMGLLTMILGTTLGLMWRHWRSGYYRRLYKTEAERRTLVEHYEHLSRYANDIILLLGERGNVIQANERAVTSYGYSRDELLRMNIRDLQSTSTLADFEARWQAAGEGRVFETLFRRKDGSTFPAEVSARDVTVDGRTVRQDIIRDISERMHAREVAQQLSGRLLRIQDQEQRRIARELHDSTVQSLSLLKVNLSRLSTTSYTPDLLADCLSVTDQCLKEVRTISYLLHPPLLDELGLIVALTSYVEGFSKRTGIATQLDLPPGMPVLPSELNVDLFRIVQECLTNIHHHSGSKSATIGILMNSDGIVLEVRDHGGGTLQNTTPHDDAMRLGMGIPGMRERAELMGGELEVKSSGDGTVVTARFPLEGISHEEDPRPGRR